MKTSTEIQVEIPVKTLANYAHQAIDKNFHKTIKWEKAVKKNEDPEALHQMRVGMRRLRTAVNRFSPYLQLPHGINDKNIGKISRILGKLRDLDVLKEILEHNYKPHLLHKEQTSLEIAFAALHKQREIAGNHIYKLFKDEIYTSFKTECQNWLNHPNYQAFTSIPINHVLPNLLSPEISEFCLQSGWLIGTEIIESEILIAENFTQSELEKKLQTHGKKLHNLRKKAKGLRYQMELFSELYSENFSNQILEIKQIQEILGMLQDTIVLHEWLDNIFKSKLDSELRGLTTLLAVNRYQLWQEWQPIQKRYLQPETRYNLHLIVLQPTPIPDIINISEDSLA